MEKVSNKAYIQLLDAVSGVLDKAENIRELTLKNLENNRDP